MQRVKLFLFLCLMINLGCMSSAAVGGTSAPPTAAMPVVIVPGSLTIEQSQFIERTVCVQKLNVRLGPGVSWSVVDYRYAGDVVRITDFKDGWAEIGAVRWVNARFLC